MRKLTAVLLVVLSIVVLASCELGYNNTARGRLNVVAIGNDFKKPDQRKVVVDGKEYTFAELHSCENDANAVCDVFEALALRAGMETNIVRLPDRYKAQFVSALENLAQSASDNDLTVIFVSTHGKNFFDSPASYSEDIAQKAFFILEESESSTTFMRSRKLMEYAERIPGTVLVVGDFCYSGSLIEQDNFTYNSDNYKGSSSLSLLFGGGETGLSSRVFVLTASSYYEVSYAGNPLSRFTGHFLNALGLVSYSSTSGETVISGAPAEHNGRILLSDVYGYVYEKTRQTQQTQMSTGAFDLVLFSFN